MFLAAGFMFSSRLSGTHFGSNIQGLDSRLTSSDCAETDTVTLNAQEREITVTLNLTCF